METNFIEHHARLGHIDLHQGLAEVGGHRLGQRPLIRLDGGLQLLQRGEAEVRTARCARFKISPLGLYQFRRRHGVIPPLHSPAARG